MSGIRKGAARRAVLVVAITVISVAAAPASERSHHPRRHHVVLATPTPDLCREGWSQTVRYGHMVPRWGVVCR